MVDLGGVRAARKLRTRQALLEAALCLMDNQSLGSLSLREVARTAGIAPAGFYRHFPNIESLGVALVEQALTGVRTTLRAARIGLADSEEIIRRSVDVLAREVHAHPRQFRFMIRERFGGVGRVSAAIREQLRLAADELAGELRSNAIPTTATVDRWRPEDLRMVTEMIVNHMVLTAAAILDAERPEAEVEVLATARRQLQLILVGAGHWLDARG